MLSQIHCYFFLKNTVINSYKPVKILISPFTYWIQYSYHCGLSWFLMWAHLPNAKNCHDILWRVLWVHCDLEYFLCISGCILFAVLLISAAFLLKLYLIFVHIKVDRGLYYLVLSLYLNVGHCMLLYGLMCFTISILFLFILHVWVFFLHVCIYYVCASYMFLVIVVIQKRSLDSKGLELLMVVNLDMCNGT